MKKLSIYIGLIAVLSSCVETIDLELDDARQLLVVDGSITNTDSSILRLSYTGNYFENTAPDYTVEKEATVVLFEDGIAVDSLDFDADSNYFITRHVGSIGKEYYLSLTTQEGKVYSSLPETMNTVEPIDSIYYQYQEEDFGDFYVIYINTSETPGLGNYYQWKLYINDEYLSGYFDLIFAEDNLVDGNPITNWDIFYLDVEDYEEYKSSSPDGKVTVRVEQMGINQGYYDFLRLLFEQTAFVGGPFSPPPAEIESNVTIQGNPADNPMGYFFSASIESAEVTIDE